MIIQPIVEGQGEEQAVPVLLRRLVAEAGAWTVSIARPHRRKRSFLVQRDSLQKAVRVARMTTGCGAVLVLVDSDDDCPKDLAPNLSAWGREAAGPTPCEIVLANREYEAWILAGIAPLRGYRRVRTDAADHPDPEAPRDAKGQLESRLVAGTTYMPTVDQASLSSAFDLADAYRSCRSFRRLIRAFGSILESAGVKPTEWPPAPWETA